MQIVSRAQLSAAGYSWDRIRAQIDAGRWRAVNELVICRHNGPLTRAERLAAVYLSARQPAALCGLTAAELWGLRGFGCEQVHLLVPKGARPCSVPGVVVSIHESRRFGRQGVVEIGGLGMTDIHRSVIDACAWSADATTAARVIVAAVQQHRSWPDQLTTALEAAGKIRHAPLLRALLHDLAGRAQALSEVEFLAFCRRNRLPRPQLQHRTDAGGRRRYLDARFRRGDGGLLLVEVDGGVHLSLTMRWNDTRKDNWSTLNGEAVLRFPSVAIYTDDAEAIEQIRVGIVGLSERHRVGARPGSDRSAL